MKLQNLIAATYTPLKENGSLNLDLVDAYSAYLKKNQVAGAFVNGSTGDFASLTVEERKLIIESWSEKRSEDFKVINHVGHTSLKVAKDLTRHCAELADGISALSPFYFKPRTLQCLVDFCKEIALCAPNLPFYYYHIPDLTGADYAMADFLELASVQIPNLAGIKFTKNNLIDYKYCKNFDNEKYTILYGVDELFLSSLPYGASGWVGSTYNHLAPLYYKIREAFHKGDYNLASELQTKSTLFVDILNNRGGFNGAGKSFMKVIGIDCGPCRFPHKTFSNGELNEVAKILEGLDIMSFTGKL
jgi:N-acetylneuraminate lyase